MSERPEAVRVDGNPSAEREPSTPPDVPTPAVRQRFYCTEPADPDIGNLCRDCYLGQAI